MIDNVPKTSFGWPIEVMKSQWHLYKPVYTNNLYPVGEREFWPMSRGEPVYVPRNFFHPGEEVEIPEGKEHYFAYGNSSWKQAKVIFLCDSNHTIESLIARRINFAAKHLFPNGEGLLLLEGALRHSNQANPRWIKINEKGLPEETTQNSDNRIRFNGWENANTLKAINLNERKGLLSIILDERNKDLKKSIDISLSDLPDNQKLAVYIGEAHMNKELSGELKDIPFVAIYDREVVVMSARQLSETMQAYKKNMFNILEQFRSSATPDVDNNQSCG